MAIENQGKGDITDVRTGDRNVQQREPEELYERQLPVRGLCANRQMGRLKRPETGFP